METANVAGKKILNTFLIFSSKKSGVSFFLIICKALEKKPIFDKPTIIVLSCATPPIITAYASE